MCFTLALVYALAIVISYDRKWRYNLEHHLLTMLAVSITIVTDDNLQIFISFV